MEPHKHDQPWIRQQINQLPDHLRDGAKRAYIRTYDELISSDTPNLARRTANTRLRKYVEKVLNSTTARQAP